MSLCGFGLEHAVHQQERIDELVTGEAFGKGIELRAIPHFTEQLLGAVRRDAEHADGAAGGPDQARHQVHEGGFAGAVRPTRLVMPGGMARFTRLTPSTSP